MPERRGGFTLIELVVVVLVIGILLGLLVPAVQAARRASWRLGCAQNLHQIGVALASYEGSNGCYPVGRPVIYDPRVVGPDPCSARFVDKSLFVGLLPYLEQAPLYHALNQDVSIFAAENLTIQSQRLAALACPADPVAGALHDADPTDPARLELGLPASGLRFGLSSYSGCQGSFDVVALPLPTNGCAVDPRVRQQADGAFTDLKPIRVADVTDGLGHTIFLAEKAVTRYAALDRVVPDCSRRYGWYFSGNRGDTLFSTFYPPMMDAVVSELAGVAHVLGATSNHPGGLNVLLGDGSARFVADGVDTWRFDGLSGLPVGATLDARGFWKGVPPFGVWQKLGAIADGSAPGDGW